jgi:cytochrome c553
MGSVAPLVETAIDNEFRKQAMKKFVRFCTALCFVATMAAGPAGCESTSAHQQSASFSQTRGKAIYQHSCVGCHAEPGTGDAFTAVPALAGQRFEYLREEIRNFSIGERHSSRMQLAFAHAPVKPLQSADDLASYLSQLPLQRFAQDDLRFHEEGEKEYASLCSACHAKDARGNSAGTIPSLRAQHDSYLVNRLRRFASTSPTVKISAHELDDHAVVAISAYLSSLRGMDYVSSGAAQP